MNFVFGNMSAVDIFIKERAIFIHETISGYYRVSAYFFAKIFCDVLPQRVFPIIFFAVITYFMIGFQVSADKMLFYLLNIILTSLAGTSVALCFSASTRQHTIGTIFTALVWVVMMVYSGVLVNIETIPRWLQWINWLSIFRYSINGFVVNEISGMTFCDQPIESIINGTVSITNGTCISGGTYLTEQGINHETAWDLWSNELALSLFTLFFLVITYVQLRRTATLK
jgi:ATP-binding cassette subfamily G (WHITE) protein 2